VGGGLVLPGLAFLSSRKQRSQRRGGKKKKAKRKRKTMDNPELNTLLSMGFEENLARGTLAHYGDLETAILMLLSGQGVAQEEGAPELVQRVSELPPLLYPIEECSLIKPYGPYYSASCGYCKQKDTFHLFACNPFCYFFFFLLFFGFWFSCGLAVRF
jgi:hypothetical protein